jgi:hypothetical protein
MKTLKRKCEVDSGVSKKMKVEDEQKWQQLRSDMVAHLNGANYECLAKYLLSLVMQFIRPSWVLNPAYKMCCCKCDKKAWFIDFEDALKHDWVPDHCPDHLPEYLGGQRPWDYIDNDQENIDWQTFWCMECDATAMYQCTIDADDYDWWSDDGMHWCPDHCHDGYLYTNGRQMHCCECATMGVYEDLEEAYEHGWWVNDDLEYCSECAGEAIRKDNLK